MKPHNQRLKSLESMLYCRRKKSIFDCSFEFLSIQQDQSIEKAQLNKPKKKKRKLAIDEHSPSIRKNILDDLATQLENKLAREGKLIFRDSEFSSQRESRRMSQVSDKTQRKEFYFEDFNRLCAIKQLADRIAVEKDIQSKAKKIINLKLPALQEPSGIKGIMTVCSQQSKQIQRISRVFDFQQRQESRKLRRLGYQLQSLK